MSKYSTRDLKISIKNNAIDRVIENLSIRVVTTKTLSSVPNQAVIEIFQLYQHSREELYNNVYDFDENIGVTKIEVTLDEKVLFQGDLINVNSIYSKQDTEWKTILNCGDGYNAYRSTTSKKYDKGTDRESIVDDLIGELESTGVVVKGAVEGLTNCTKKSLLKAILVNGEVINNIKGLMKDCFKDVDVYMQDNSLWKIKDNIEWIEDCPLPEGEVIRQLI